LHKQFNKSTNQQINNSTIHISKNIPLTPFSPAKPTHKGEFVAAPF